MDKKYINKECELCESEFTVSDTKRGRVRRFCGYSCSNRSIRLGKKHSDETKKKISEKTKGVNNPFYGKKHSDETKEKISDANKWVESKLKKCSLLDKEKEILDGLMLSDGCLTDTSRVSARFTFGFKHKEMSEKVISNLPSLTFSPLWESKITNCWHGKSHMFSTLLRENIRWYVNGLKIIPKDILLTKTSCYWWYIGDGYLTDDCVFLCTDSFTEEDVGWLVKRISELGFKCSRTSRNRIRFYKEDSIKFLMWIDNNIIKKYEYKWKILK